MPLFELKTDGQGNTDELVPFRQLRGGTELYESELERLVWENFEDLTGESLFRVTRQAVITGGRPDIVALDSDARVIVIEIKRDVDRGQLAQCLEYAGWARTTSLDELAGMYHRGPNQFFADWQQFTDSDAPLRIERSPRLMLVAHDYHGRTGSAFEFLVENGLPVKLIRVSLYEDQAGRRFLDVEGEHEPDFSSEQPSDDQAAPVDATMIDGRRVRITDLIDAGLLEPHTHLIWVRPRLGEKYSATVGDAGTIKLEDGREFSSPSRAAMEAAEVPAYDGWYAWRIGDSDGESLHDLRVRLATAGGDVTGT